MFFSPNTYANGWDIFQSLNFITKYFIYGDKVEKNMISFKKLIGSKVDAETSTPEIVDGK